LSGKYESLKTYYYTDKSFGYTMENRPTLTMIAFAGPLKASAAVTGEVEEGVDDLEITVTINNPYDDYLDYLRTKMSGAGWFVDSESEKLVKEIKATYYNIKVEKSSNAPMRILTYVYHLPDADVAVEYMMFESEYAKLSKGYLKTFKSFRLIEKKASALSGAIDLSVLFTEADTPKERKEVRIQVEEDQRAKAVANLTDGWEAVEIGKYLVLNHTDKSFAKAVVKQLDSLLSWANKAFDYVGPDEYVRTPIVRICADYSEERSFQSGNSWSFVNMEILTHRSTAGATSYEWGYINRRGLSFWFSDRNRDVWNDMPPWMKNGLNFMTHSGKAKGSKMVFAPSTRENNVLRELKRSDSILAPSVLLRLPIEDFREQEIAYQSSSFMRWLLVGKGAKFKLTRGLVEDVLVGLQTMLIEKEAADDSAEDQEEDSGPATEEEEDAAFAENDNAYLKRLQATQDELFERVFSNWKTSDWEKLDKAYLKTL